MNWLKKIFEGNKEETVEEWRTENSILVFLQSHLAEDGKLNETADRLPDEVSPEEDGEDEKLRFAPGLMDAMVGADDSDETRNRTNELYKLAIRIANYGDQRSAYTFYRLITSNDGVMDVIDDFLEKLVNSEVPVEPHMYAFSKDLAFRTAHRNSVKFGIAILGMCQNKEVLPDIKLLGLHDEFTLFSAVAIANLSDELTKDLWELAQKVDGWGKIQVVRRLTREELPEDVKDWLLRYGYKNNIMHEYLAYTCAVHGELAQRLAAVTIDKDLFKAASEITDALLMGGPAEDITVYEEAAISIERFLGHAKYRAEDISDFLLLNRLKEFLVDLQNKISEYSQNGWTDDNVSNRLIETIEIIGAKDWAPMVHEALNSEDSYRYWNGKQAAKLLDIPIWDIAWKRLLEKPEDIGLWFDVTQEAQPEQASQVIELALQTLHLKEIATGPKDSLGFGTKYAIYQPLDPILSFLENRPGKAEAILLAALFSPITRNRNMALNVLEKWQSANWSTEIRERVLELQAIEPNSNTKNTIDRLLAEG